MSPLLLLLLLLLLLCSAGDLSRRRQLCFKGSYFAV
jgi:hypothetical protein